MNVETLRPSNNQILRKFASSHYQSYTTALSVTIAVGCFLLLLNILIFFGIYHQRDRSSSAEKKKKKHRKKKEELADSCSSSSGDGHHLETKHALAALVDEMAPSASSPTLEMPLQEFSCSPPPGSKRPIPGPAPGAAAGHSRGPSPAPAPGPGPGSMLTGSCSSLQGMGVGVGSLAGSGLISGLSSTHGSQTCIPEPPPPPKGQPPNQLCNSNSLGLNSSLGILRSQGCPSTPSSTKKRVHIQEISV